MDNNDFGSGICLLKFSAEWCGPCKKMQPTIEKLENEFKHVKFVYIDVDKDPEVAKNFNIRSIPTLVILKGGKEINRVIGSSLIDPLRKILRESDI